MVDKMRNLHDVGHLHMDSPENKQPHGTSIGHLPIIADQRMGLGKCISTCQLQPAMQLRCDIQEATGHDIHPSFLEYEQMRHDTSDHRLPHIAYNTHLLLTNSPILL